ncbi:MAG: SPFH domain-containing protein [Alphaproteobacteria bacterium]|nr:SPFH domain-containing protein [Alphaproteobacteria bacterium]MDD9920526.1 SPFH domain-containing protein [Alphaproteobacteria bacterium]
MEAYTTLIVLAVVAFLLLRTMVHIVNGKTAMIVETFGKPERRARMPGLQITWPWPIQTVAGRINLQQQEIKANVSVKTSDNAFMSVPATVQFRASSDPTGAIKAFYELENPEQQITSYILNNVRQTVSGMEMSELYANRDGIKKSVEEALTEEFTTFGFIINTVLVDEPQPSAEVQDAFNRVIAAKREAEAAQMEAEAQRIRLVGVAQAEKESKRLQGEGIAEQREAIAKGIQAAMETCRTAMPGMTDKDIMDFLLETNRQDMVSDAASHGNVILTDTTKRDHFSDTLLAIGANDALVKSPASTAKKKSA